MHLHLPRDPGIISLVEQHTLMTAHVPRRHLVSHGVSTALVEDSRVSRPEDTDVIRDLLPLVLQDAVSDLHRRQLQSDVRLPGLTAVPLFVQVQRPVWGSREPSARERSAEAVVEAEVSRPVCRDLERRDDVRPQPVLVVRGIVDELLEDLSLKGIPVTVQQRPPERLRFLFQLEDVVIRDERILHRQRRDVLRPDRLRLVQGLREDHLLLDAEIRPSVHEHLLHPAMPDVAGVAGRAHDGNHTKALLRTKPGLDEVIDRLLEAGQLVEI